MQAVIIETTNTSENTMNLAKNYAYYEYNPIDTVEHIFNSRSYELDRRNINEVVIEVQGKWNNMLLFFAWEPSMNCMHMSCLMGIACIAES